MLKKRFVLLMVFFISFITACGESKERVPISKFDTMKVSSGETKLEQILDVEGFDFKLLCTYDTGNYTLNEWRITDSKILSMTVKTIDLPEDWDVIIEHVHCDINIKSTLDQIDGMPQDSMDASYHGSSQDGFPIDNNTFYNNKFAIEGYSKTLIDGWAFIVGSYGSADVTEKRLTEKNLIKQGKAYAQKMSIIYSLGIKKPGNDKYQVVAVESEFLIPLNTERYNIH